MLAMSWKFQSILFSSPKIHKKNTALIAIVKIHNFINFFFHRKPLIPFIFKTHVLSAKPDHKVYSTKVKFSRKSRTSFRAKNKQPPYKHTPNQNKQIWWKWFISARIYIQTHINTQFFQCDAWCVVFTIICILLHSTLVCLL